MNAHIYGMRYVEKQESIHRNGLRNAQHLVPGFLTEFLRCKMYELY